MDYRGSKSFTANIPLNFHSVIVKEQRVDGNYIGNPMLRCTLMGLERDYRNKILSKSLNRYYSTNIIPKDTSQKNDFQLDPNFVSGFIDGEGSFSVTFIKDKSYKRN